MNNWNGIICALLGALVYMANSEILPTWSHTLVGIFSALILIAAYWLAGNRLKMWIRASIAAVVTILAAVIARLLLP